MPDEELGGPTTPEDWLNEYLLFEADKYRRSELEPVVKGSNVSLGIGCHGEHRARLCRQSYRGSAMSAGSTIPSANFPLVPMGKQSGDLVRGRYLSDISFFP